VDKKADSKYKPVSAASVCAKVARDHALKEWTFPEGSNVIIGPNGWGSGYPAGGWFLVHKFLYLFLISNVCVILKPCSFPDPVTKKFLRANIDPVFGFPNIVRNSWATAETLLKEKAVKMKW